MASVRSVITLLQHCNKTPPIWQSIFVTPCLISITRWESHRPLLLYCSHCYINWTLTYGRAYSIYLTRNDIFFRSPIIQTKDREGVWVSGIIRGSTDYEISLGTGCQVPCTPRAETEDQGDKSQDMYLRISNETTTWYQT